jgi:hypothetical protein
MPRMEWCSGSFFVIGPPVQKQGLQDVVEEVLQRVVPLWFRNFYLEDILGPVAYRRSWLPGGRASLRTALDGCDLFCANAWWQSEEDPPESFTIAVMDKSCYDGYAEASDDKIPDFETFVVSMFRGEAVKSDRAFQWKTYCKPHWSDRSRWLQIYNPQQSEREYGKSVESLKGSRWQNFIDINKLFAKNKSTSTRNSGQKGKKGTGKGPVQSRASDFRLYTRELRLDSILPIHLIQFMASFIPRPASYEQLCSKIFAYEMEIMIAKQNDDFRDIRHVPFLDHVNSRSRNYEPSLDLPDWLRDIATLASAKSSFALSRYWWACQIDEASKTIQAFLSFLASFHNWENASIVTGLAAKGYKKKKAV